MSERHRLLESIAKITSDYRTGEVAAPSPEHVERWVAQFDPKVRDPLLAEMEHVLRRSYLSRKTVTTFLGKQVMNNKLAGASPCAFWKAAHFLRIQKNGHSQEEMLDLFADCLKSQCSIDLADCGSAEGAYIYLDDASFSGSRMGSDLEEWILTKAPKKATVHVLVIAVHALGEFLATNRLDKAADRAGKKIDFHIWRAITIENRKAYRHSSEVLWPVSLPRNKDVQAYADEEDRYPFEPRTAIPTSTQTFFTSEAGRQLLEREMLLAGVRIRSMSANPKKIMRPLGFSAFGLGFGSMIVTFRNCPNNCPLALWWGDPDSTSEGPLNWYPLFPRKTY
ncbi:MAG: hypothetical protein AAB074_21145 [Planctomycetota bacterium]